MKIAVGLVDDHHMVLKSLGFMISYFNNFEVTLEALNGNDLKLKLATTNTLPEIMLVDVNMPVMDGVQVARWLRKTYPSIKVVALSMNENESSIIKMLNAGCCAYLFKKLSPEELEHALNAIHQYGFYNGELDLTLLKKGGAVSNLSDQELTFLRLVCSDRTYAQISAEMHLSESRVDDIRQSLFTKLRVKTRVGLVLETIKQGIVTL